MRKFHFSLKSCLIALVSVSCINMETISADYPAIPTKGTFFDGGQKFKTPMHKVQMTQRGYIQFLRWGISVPEITEFTFCLWIQSTNTTYAQSFFSYSRNEKERLIRSWISPRGQSIFLEINNVQIFQLPFSMEENRWYHLCQSWRSKDGRYAMWIDGRLATENYAREMIGYVIPSKGDIVVGQEFTDFDKGLEEGIEGSILGFNFLLASAFHLQELPTTAPAVENILPIFPISEGLYSVPNLFSRFTERLDLPSINQIGRRSFQKRSAQNPFIFFKSNQETSDKQQRDQISFRDQGAEKNTNLELNNDGTITEPPLGLQLVIISFSRCEIGRGSPFIGGHLMLISWTRSSVRVFGGALVKPVKSECGNF